MTEPATFHDLSLSRECGQRKTVGDRLAECREIRDNIVDALSAADIPTEPCDHLVQNHQRAEPIAQRTHLCQESPTTPRRMPVRDLPVMGAVKGGAEGFYFNEGEAKEIVVRPPILAGVSNAFALYVDGESMEPRYYAGEMLYVNPNRPITRGRLITISMRTSSNGSNTPCTTCA